MQSQFLASEQLFALRTKKWRSPLQECFILRPKNHYFDVLFCRGGFTGAMASPLLSCCSPVRFTGNNPAVLEQLIALFPSRQQLGPVLNSHHCTSDRRDPVQWSRWYLTGLSCFHVPVELGKNFYVVFSLVSFFCDCWSLFHVASICL